MITFDFRLETAQVRLIDTDEALLPVAGALHHLAYLLRFLLVCESTDAIAGDNVLKYSELGQEGELPDEGVIGHGFWVRGRGYFDE